MNCPKCSTTLNLKAIVPSESRMTMELHRDDGQMFQASTVGEVLVQLERALKATAKELGGKVAVYIRDIRCTENLISIDTVTITAKENSK